MYNIITPPADFHAGTDATKFRKMLEIELQNYPVKKYCLNLTNITYMDSYTFRIVFDFRSKFSKIIPPKSNKVVEMYNVWITSKKGLEK